MERRQTVPEAGSLTIQLRPDTLHLTIGEPAGEQVRAVGTGLRDAAVDHWTECQESQSGRVVVIDLTALVARYPSEAIVDLWLSTEPRLGDGPTQRRMGRFTRTVRSDETAEVAVGGRRVRLRVNVHGNVILVVGDAVKPRPFAVEGRALSLRNGVLSFDGSVTAFDREIVRVELQVPARQSETSASVTLTTEVNRPASEAAYGAVVHRVTGALDLRELLGRLDPADTLLDPRLVLTDATGSSQRVRLNERHVADGVLETVSVTVEGSVAHVVPHFTFLWGGFSLRVDRFTPRAHAALELVMRRPWWAAVARRLLGIWLIGEVPNKAQDNGYFFFRWVRARRPWRLAFYVIDPRAPDLWRVERFGRVVERGSVKHVLLTACAARLVGTHHADYLLPTTDPRMIDAAPGNRIMLQHGVLGTKNMTTTYGRDGRVRAADVFHVSSPRERGIVVEDLGYEPDRVRVTGLPRFDSLLEPSPSSPHGLLVIPTWRSWITDRRQFDESEFRARWSAFFGHPRMRALVDGGERVSFVLHPNMGRFADGFELDGIDFYRQGDRLVQDLLREHAALVTDYSSVAFDFALLGRPVLYFQFDRPRYFRTAPSHLDLDAELPGPVLFDEDTLAAAVAEAHSRGFRMTSQYRERAVRVFPHHDRRSSRRVYESVRRGSRGRMP